MTPVHAHLGRRGVSLRNRRNTTRVREAFAEMKNGTEVALELRSGERLRGVFCGFVDDQALLSSLRGRRCVPAREVEKILIKATALGREPRPAGPDPASGRGRL